jgi:hypothetical protein
MEGKLPAFFRRLFRIGRREDPLLERYLRRNRDALDRQRQESDVSGLDDHLMEDLPSESLAQEDPGVDEEAPSELEDQNQGNLFLGHQDARFAETPEACDAYDPFAKNERRRSQETGEN